MFFFCRPFCSQADASPWPGLPEAESRRRWAERLWKDAGQAQGGKKRKRGGRRKRKVRCQWGSSQPVQPSVSRWELLRNAAQSGRPMPERSSVGCVCHAGARKLNSHFLSSDDPGVMEPKVQRSIGNSGTQLVSFPLFFTGFLVLFVSTLHWSRHSSVEPKLSQCRSLGPRTLKTFFLYRSFYKSMDYAVSVRLRLCLCECGTLIAPKKRSAFFFL